MGRKTGDVTAATLGEKGVAGQRDRAELVWYYRFCSTRGDRSF
jgi:hypothetical protein